MKIHLRTKPRKKSHLVIGVICVALLVPLVFFFSPEHIVVRGLFFMCFLVGLFYVAEFLVGTPRRALLISIGTTLYLLLRSLELRHWLYPLLIVAIIVAIELYYRKK